MEQITAEDYLRSLKGDELRSVVRGLGLKNHIKNFSKMPRADLLENLIPLCQLVVHKDGRCSLYAKSVPEISVRFTHKEDISTPCGSAASANALGDAIEGGAVTTRQQTKKAKKAKEVDENVVPLVQAPVPADPTPLPAEPVAEPVAEPKKKATKKGSKVKAETSG